MKVKEMKICRKCGMVFFSNSPNQNICIFCFDWTSMKDMKDNQETDKDLVFSSEEQVA